MQARDFLTNLSVIVIAVVDEHGKPWAVPVALQKYHKGKLEWFSKTDTVHSQAIELQPQIALTAFQTKRDEGGEYGFYAQAVAHKKLSMPGGLALYEAEITKAWYNTAKHVKTDIDLKDL